MSTRVDQLRAENERLKQQVATLEQNYSQIERDYAGVQRRYAQSEREKELLREELARERSRFFGRSSEKLSDAERTQGRLFDEAEVAAAGDLFASGLLVIRSSLTPMAAGPSRRRKPPTRHRPRNAPNRRLTRRYNNLDLSREVELAAQR